MNEQMVRENQKNLEQFLKMMVEDVPEEDLLLDTLQASIATTIISARNALGMTQKDLANRMNVSQSLVSRWEKGETNFTLKTLVEIAQALHLSMRSPFSVAPVRTYTPPKKRQQIIHFPCYNGYSNGSGWISDGASERFEEMRG